MCAMAAIPGILPAWTYGDIQEKSLSVERVTPQPTERAHAIMTTEKIGKPHQLDTTFRANDAMIADFGTLYEKFRRPIHSYIYRIVGSQEDADDITQEVFTRAYLAWNDLYDRGNLSPWLYRIATNLCVDLLRRRKRISWWPLSWGSKGENAREQRQDDEAGYLPPDSGGIPEVGEREHIRRALAAMPEEYAIALILSAAQGVPYQEVAAIVGISPNAAATRISRAKRIFAELYQRLNEEGVEARGKSR